MPNQNSYPPISAPMLERYLLERHKEAGQLPASQHVYTLEDIQYFLRLWSTSVGKAIIESDSSDKNKRDKVSRLNSQVLDEACKNYRELNKTK